MRVVDWMSANHVEAGHRHEQRQPARVDISHPRASVAETDDRDSARQLIEETERFLEEREYRP